MQNLQLHFRAEVADVQQNKGQTLWANFTCEVRPGLGLDSLTPVLTSIGFHILVYLLKLGFSAGLSKTRGGGGLTKFWEFYIVKTYVH